MAILEHWHAIIGLLFGGAFFIFSIVAMLRYFRNKEELAEIQTFIKKNKVIREEISEINDELTKHRDRISALETELLKEKLENLTLRNQNDALLKHNRTLITELDKSQQIFYDTFIKKEEQKDE